MKSNVKHRVEELWHQDAAGQIKPHLLLNKKYVHLASATLYVVTGFFLNATSDKWCISYDRCADETRKEFGFTRDMDEFLDGRFVEVK